jgi:hypothetical protein
MPILRGGAYWAHGCSACREGWERDHTIDSVIGVSGALQTPIYRCVVCGTYWQETGRGVVPITRERAEWALTDAPDDLDPLAEFLLIDTPEVVLRDGLVLQPSAPAWGPGLHPLDEWYGQVVAAIAGVLGVAGPLLLRWTTSKAQGLTSSGYGAILAADVLDWQRVDARMWHTGDVTPDAAEGPVRRIGFNALYQRTYGPRQLVAVDSGEAGRQAVRERESDFERASR